MNRLAYFSETFHESDWKSAPEAKRARDARAKAVRADGYNVKVTGGPGTAGTAYRDPGAWPPCASDDHR